MATVVGESTTGKGSELVASRGGDMGKVNCRRKRVVLVVVESVLAVDFGVVEVVHRDMYMVAWLSVDEGIGGRVVGESVV